MHASISKVYPAGENYRFFAEVTLNRKGYEFGNKREAVKARARLLKRFKADGFKVFC